MSLEKKIKEAFKKDKKIREANKWDPDTQPNLYELYNFLRKSGYRLVDVADSYKKRPELIIEPVEPGHLHPEINHDISDGRFYINVSEHGYLDPSDVVEVIKGYEAAISVVAYLSSLDLDKLEIDQEDEDEE